MPPSKVFDNWPPSLGQPLLEELRLQAIDWSASHGMQMRNWKSDGITAESAHVPFALFPSPFPRDAFHAVGGELQIALNLLVHRMSLDQQFIETIFEPLAKVDRFTGRLYEIWKRVVKDPAVSTIKRSRLTMGIHRSDYMLHRDPLTDICEPKMVELNTMSVSFASLSALTGDLHRYLTRRTNYFNDLDKSAVDIELNSLPTNEALNGLAAGLAEAWSLYQNPEAVIVMVVQPGERNIFDQRLIEYSLFETRGIRVVRKTLRELYDQLDFEKSTGILKIRNGPEVAIFYFRSGYAPTDYPSDLEWQAREMIERSASVKCPNIAYQLIGAKKVQQVLALPQIVEKYLYDIPEMVKLIRSTFTGIYPLDQSELGKSSYEMAISDTSKSLVLKPQREGGGNNYYGEDVREKLLELSIDERSAYILMDLIEPPPYKNVLVRNCQILEADVVSELGIFGVYIQ